jgi:uncharacterized protein YqgV (UPF0045/DUF77 family)
MFKPLVLAIVLAFSAQAQAQQTPIAAPAAPAPLPTSPAKKQLVAKILAIQQPGIEALARQLVEQPAAQLLQQAGPALQQRVAAEQREAVGREIQADARKFVDEAVPVVRERAIKLAPTTIGTVLEERMTEDELKQVLQILESPANKKFQSLAGDMQRALAEKLVAETRPLIQPKVQALEQSVAKRLGITPPPAGAAPAAGK